MSVAFLAVLFFFVSSAFAQPWQWQPIENFWNPMGFPAPPSNPLQQAIGDFNGDGRNEYLAPTYDGFIVAVRDTGRFHWRQYHGAQDLRMDAGFNESLNGLTAYDVDHDGQDELLTFSDSVRCWKTVSLDPWILERADSLASWLDFPSWTRKAVIGDFDGDGNLEKVCMGWYGWTLVYSFDGTATWSMDMEVDTSDVYGASGLFDGDFDHDGQRDWALVSQYWGVGPYAYFYSYDGHRYVRRTDWNDSLYGIVNGGDLDGDGQWEGLIISNATFFDFDHANYLLAETRADTGQFIAVDSLRTIGPFRGNVLGNARRSGGPIIASVYTSVTTDGGNMQWNFEPILRRGDSTWSDASFGLSRQQRVGLSSSVADLDGDGLRDVFQVQVVATGYPPSGYEWWIWKNAGNDTLDRFPDSTSYQVLRFLSNRDTGFGDPQIGDVDGDGRAELAVLGHATGQPWQVLFYDLVGPIADTTFELHPGLNLGLPTGFEGLRLADIDSDGVTELFGKGGDVWRSYDYDQGSWHLVENVLPDVGSNDLMFADFNNDGRLDLFTPTDAWLNLGPVSVNDRFALQPSSLILSAFPNPFNPSTTIHFELAHAGKVTVNIYDVMGRRAATLLDGPAIAGSHDLHFDASHLSSGVYFARLESREGIRVAKLLLMR
jgi:hypothetical protein